MHHLRSGGGSLLSGLSEESPPRSANLDETRRKSLFPAPRSEEPHRARTFRADTPKYSTSEKMKRVFRKPPGPSSLSDRGRPAALPTEPRRSNTRIEHKKALPDKCGSSSQAIVGHKKNLSAHPGAHNAFPTSRRIRSLLPAFSGPKPSCSLSDPDITRFCRNSVKSRKTPFSQADESQDSFQKCLMDHNAPCFLNQTIRKFFVRSSPGHRAHVIGE
jgi:hypothetical protein